MISFLIGFILVVTIEMPFSGAVRTVLSHLTPKIKGKTPSLQLPDKKSEPTANDNVAMTPIEELKTDKQSS